MAHETTLNQHRIAGSSETEHRRQEVQQAVKSACNQLRKDGVDPRNYVEQLAWLFFLKAFDEMECRHEEESAFDDTPYTRRLDDENRWSSWSSLINRPDEMLQFVDETLFPHLKTFGQTENTLQFTNDPVAERFRRIFSTVRNHSRRGANFARVVQQVNRLHFGDATDVIVLSELYEGLLKDVAADSAGYAGEFYTQRHIIKAMVEVVSPRIGDCIYDPCFGTAGFLAESAKYITKTTSSLSGTDLERLTRGTFFGIEQKPLTFLLGEMNMLLHRIEEANLRLGDTLELHSPNVMESDRFNVILSNPPYGGTLARETQSNFTIRSGSTEILFLQHIMTNLAAEGRAAVILPEGVLFRGGHYARVRERLVRDFNVHTILSLPAGCFQPYTDVKTNVVFFNRAKDGRGTKDVWYYELTNDGFDLRSTRRPIKGSQIPDFLEKRKDRLTGENSWTVPIKVIAERDWDLSARNPNQKVDIIHESPLDLVKSIMEKEQKIVEHLRQLEMLLKGIEGSTDSTCIDKWETKTLDQVATLYGGGTPSRSNPEYFGSDIEWVTPSDLPPIGNVGVLGPIAQGLTRRGLENSSAKEIAPGSVLFSSRASIGKIAVTDRVCATNQGFANFVPIKPEVDPWFLAYLLCHNTPAITRLAGETTYKEISRKKLKAFALRIPNIEVQRRIVDRIKLCMARVHDIQSLRLEPDDDVAVLTASILQRALSGEF